MSSSEMSKEKDKRRFGADFVILEEGIFRDIFAGKRPKSARKILRFYTP